MSTRSQVLVHGHNAIVYRHSDGYPDGPSGVLKALLPLCADFIKFRGFDPEYLTAHIAAEFIRLHRAWFKRAQRQRMKDGYPFGPMDRQTEFIGHGVEAWDGVFHGDVEYIYIVHKDHVEVRHGGKGFWDNSTLANTDLVKKVRFDGKGYGRPRKKDKIKDYS